MQFLLDWWKEFAQRPAVAHLLRAIERFNVRGGTQLAAAVAFYSILSLVPIVMLGFSALGLVLTVVRPEALGMIEAWLAHELNPASELGGKLYDLITQFLSNWASVGLVGLGIIIWVGSGWVGNLKRAVRLLMREDVDNPRGQLPLPLDVLANFAGLIGFLIAVAVTVAATALASYLGREVGNWLGIDGELWQGLISLVLLIIAVAASTLMFRLLFLWFSPHPVPGRLTWYASLAGAVVLIGMQSLAGLLISAFSRNLSIALFGSTVVLMIFLNIFATTILLLACWLATAVVSLPVVAPPAEIPDEPPPADADSEVVSLSVARRSLGVGLRTGYLAGAATGFGVGALLARILTRRPRG